jgi:DNA-directed RNA polymerase specialized sigma24 family protein
MPIKDHVMPIAEFPQEVSLDALGRTTKNGEIIPIQIAEPEHTQVPTDLDQLQLVRQALSHLTKKQREVIELRYGLGDIKLPRIQDLAEHFSLHPKAIEYRHIRALKRLRALFCL